MPICQYVIVIELDKRHLFIYIPWTKSGLLTLFTYAMSFLWHLTTCFPFMPYGLSYIVYIVYIVYHTVYTSQSYVSSITIIDTIILHINTNDAYISYSDHYQGAVLWGLRSNYSNNGVLQLDTLVISQPGRCHMPICQYVIVIELDKICLFIYIPICMDQIWTFNLCWVYIHADWSFC
jgi:hypothetical protein